MQRHGGVGKLRWGTKGAIGGGVALAAILGAFWGWTLKGMEREGSESKGPEGMESYYAQLRRQMVEEQIIARGVRDPKVISALLKVPRHEFVPFEYRHLAYEDHPLPIGLGQTISQPYMVALMTEALKLSPTDKVLEIGTGSGYQAAILAEICKEVYTIEILPELTERAKKTLERLGYKNVHVKCGDGFLGWPEEAPFDAIIVTCASPYVPPPLIQQLAEGGRLVIPVGEQPVQTLVRLERAWGKILREAITECLFVPMTGENVERWRVPKEVEADFRKAFSSLDQLIAQLRPDKPGRLEFWCSLPLDSPSEVEVLPPSLAIKALEYVKGVKAKAAVVPASVESLTRKSEVYQALKRASEEGGIALAILAHKLTARDFDRFASLCRDLIGEAVIISSASREAEKLAKIWPSGMLLFLHARRPSVWPGMPSPDALFLSTEYDLQAALKFEQHLRLQAVICGPYAGGWLNKIEHPGPWKAVLDGKMARVAAYLAQRIGAKKVILLPGKALVDYPDRPLDLRKAVEESKRSALYGALRTLIEEFELGGG